MKSNTNPLPSVGFIGLGNMGAPMARRLLAAGYPLKAYDISRSQLESLVTDGAVVATSAASCASGVDVLMTSLPRPDHVESVMTGEAGALAALKDDAIWIDLTTNRKDLVLSLAAQAPHIRVVDSPVTGAVDGAITGRLTLFAGGDDTTVNQVEPLLSHLGKVIKAGDLGNGNTIKLVTNQLWFIAAAAIGEGFATGVANGVDLGTLWHAIKQSVGDSFVAQHDAPSIFAGHYDPSFTLDLCLKDLGLISELNQNVAADLPMTAAAHGTFKRAADKFGPAAAELHVAKHIEQEAGLSFRLDGDWVPHWESKSST